MKRNPTVYILSAAFNNLTHTKKLLACIQKQTYWPIRAFFIDDGSTDSTRAYIQKKFPNVVLLSGDGNLFWTGALFLGIQKILPQTTENDFVLTINNDCTFHNNYVASLVKENGGNKKLIIGSSVYDARHTDIIIDQGASIDWKKGEFQNKGNDILSTKGTLFPVSVFQKTGNFNKMHFPHYLSDFEFSIRAKKAGFTLRLGKNAKVYNDQAYTGIGSQVPKKLTLKNAFELLTSRKSKRNFFDHFWFISLCCPWRYKPLNFFLLFAKSIFILGKGIAGTIQRNENE